MFDTLYFDVDGVLFDFNNPFVDFWNDGLKLHLWTGNTFVYNPTTWSFGMDENKDDMSQFYKAIELFDNSNKMLPLIHKDIPHILRLLARKYTIELVTSYPHRLPRIYNLNYHDIVYDKLSCNISNKLKYVKEQETYGSNVVAIFEDAPHHIDNYLKHYPNKIWIPQNFNYLKDYTNDIRLKLYSTADDWLVLL